MGETAVTPQAQRALLRRFEPVIRYTRGEQFFPVDVDAYVRRCSLWVQRPNQLPLRLLSKGDLTLEELVKPRSHGDEAVYYLKFIEPMNLRELAAYRLREGLAKDPDEVFHAGPGRLARVGYSSRLIDALFSLSLLARGRVPGDTAAAAALAYKQMMQQWEHYCYYGRVVERGGWVALQYWFLYPFNNWRSGFYGANDHEADWEMIYVYLYEESEDQLTPEWVAYASHDFSGDNLRRHWHDPELEKVGEHPVIYAGAGSHANYYQPGEYLAELELPLVTPLVQIVDRLQEFWERNVLFWHTDNNGNWSDFSIFRVPFVDYARGDGIAIGPGQNKCWDEPMLLDDGHSWVSQYRGLWGLYASDPLSGEDAPAGPKFNQDGRVRRSWYAPLGWAGLNKTPPPNQRMSYVCQQRAAIAQRREDVELQIADLRRQLVALGVERAAMQGQAHLGKQRKTHDERITAVTTELDQLKAQLAADNALDESLALYAERVESGQPEPLRAHLRRAHRPASDEGLRLNSFAEMWAAASIGLMMIGFVLLVLFAREYLLLGLVALITVIVFIEAGFRRRIARLINGATVALAIVAVLVLLFEFFWEFVVFSVLVAGGYIMWENIRELRR